MLVLIRHASSTARCSLHLVASIDWQIKLCKTFRASLFSFTFYNIILNISFTKAYQFHKITVTSLEIPDSHGLIKHFLYPHEEIIKSSIGDHFNWKNRTFARFKQYSKDLWREFDIVKIHFFISFDKPAKLY